ncbi:uncharacterized protein LOC132983068 [Labrus mixtus]|uniref:uncharacterized protein LOC132983068 n=1 Tax=Labrus mixtus TaxID=508554 RepID=UPI0029C0648F|nr:uncharacterized protein LOC132983068 [Labrus mixtus]
MKTITWFGFVLGALSAAGEVIWTKPGQTAIFKCQIDTYRSLEWLHHGNTRIIRVDGKTGQQNKAQSDIAKRSTVSETTLTVSSVKEGDAGKFTCKVYGRIQEHTLLVVSVSPSPSGVFQAGSTATLQVKGLSSGTLVQWKDPNGHLTDSATIQLEPVAPSHEGTWECLVTLDKVAYSESLEIKVEVPAPETAASLPKQNSEVDVQPPCHNCVTNPQPKETPLLELSWWVWVSLGVGCLVVILLIVFVIVLCKRIRRRKREYQRRQNGHQPLKPRQFCQCNRPTAAAKPQQGRRREKPLALPRQPLLME